ncbi:class I SAM-dependent methyltransferase [Photobacterium satsumensis]|uniref:class I SAM-dependent methyltransferase n=1 Tax=Photobacterium satsumensis TaxID=2910239 RepID=UPI003D1251EB
MTETVRHDIPADLLQPLWLRSRESLADDRLIYDPVAAAACTQCSLKPECLKGNVSQQQLLHASLTLVCDRQIQHFLRRHPDGRIINLGSGLDTRFYRVDNGRCRWFDIDVGENLLWRQRLFHRSERYRMLPGSTTDLSWLQALPPMSGAPVMVLCDHALLASSEAELAHVVQSLACHFGRFELCLVVAGDLCHSPLSGKMGVDTSFGHALRDPRRKLLQWLPWATAVGHYSPMDSACSRWRGWQRWLARIPGLKFRILPVLLHIHL